MHFDAPDDPVEDTILLARHFSAISVMYRVPDYAPGRWMLKSPGHSFGLDALRKVYPDARFVMIHRDPITVAASMLSLASSVLAVFSDSDRAAYVADYWPKALVTMADRIAGFRKQHGDAAFFAISYEDFAGNPVGVVRRLYAFLGRELTPPTEQRMRSFIADRPHGRFGRHVYRLSDFGVNAAQLHEQFREYCSWFSLPAAAYN